jgi:hypothetical protein
MTRKRIGRPTLYRKNFPKRAEVLYAAGATDAEVAKALKIEARTLYNFLDRHIEFVQAQKRGKAIADGLVEQSLFKRAIGYSHPDTHFSTYEGQVTATPMTKHYAPDPVACIFWLKNRMPAKWRDVQQVEANITVDAKLIAAARELAKTL